MRFPRLTLRLLLPATSLPPSPPSLTTRRSKAVTNPTSLRLSAVMPGSDACHAGLRRRVFNLWSVRSAPSRVPYPCTAVVGRVRGRAAGGGSLCMSQHAYANTDAGMLRQGFRSCISTRTCMSTTTWSTTRWSFNFPPLPLRSKPYLQTLDGV